MISELRIQDLGVIESATLDLAPGFTAVTGETGAGKTMIVTSLGLLLGGRADSGAVRRGADRARVEGTFTGVSGEVGVRVAEAGGELEEDALLVARQVTNNRSRCFLGGAGVPVSLAADITADLVTIHGQSEQLKLAAPDRQREILDRYAGPQLAADLSDYRRDWAERQAARAELVELRDHARERAREVDLLQFGLTEIEQIDPQPGEDHALAEEADKLQAVDDLRLAAHTALVALAGDEDSIDAGSALTAAATARKSLQDGADRDAALAPFAERATDLQVLASELAQDVAAYLSDLEADPHRLEWIAERRAALQGLTRKYGETVDEVLTWAQTSAARLGELTSSDDRIDELALRVEALDRALAARATAVTKKRQQAADRLADAVRGELTALAMPHARLEFALEPLGELGPHGAEQVVLQFTANPGSAPRPIGKVASGGELSRIRLALEVVLAEGSGTGTFVFDEVDSGVGGAVAIEIGRRLAKLSQHAQVVVVTHLAQVAAFADRHLLVRKASDGQVTTSGVHLLGDEDRVAELARMMAGLEDSDTALAHARELRTLGARRD
ncbi:DNA repair protein RecN [Granulicoccus sp. GXG6511]|uniref:DNA repair protein RecN n=1 Tax=Granulicoccus sp. GXG6511 TaxID=3381351 RepID=UPI003D7C46A5